MRELFRRLSQPQVFVWVVGAIFGTALALFTPPFRLPDERAHYMRIYQCAEGVFLSRKAGDRAGGELPRSIPITFSEVSRDDDNKQPRKLTWTYLSRGFAIPHKPEERCFCDFRNTALYSPVPYAPAIVAVALARPWQPSHLFLMYCARMANLIGCLALTSLAVWYMPVHKWVMVAVALLPVSFFIMPSLGADAVTDGLSFLALALVLRMALAADRATVSGLVALVVVFIGLALSKQVYILLVLLFFLIPRSKLPAGVKYVYCALAVIGTPVLVNIAWGALSKHLYVPIWSFVDPSAQMHFVLAHPLHFLRMVCGYALRDLHIPVWFMLNPWPVMLPPEQANDFWLCLAALGILEAREGFTFDFARRLLPPAIVVAIWFALMLVLYLSSNPVGAPTIAGLQSRYLIPLAPLVLLPLGSPRALRAVKPPAFLVPALAMGLALVSGLTILTGVVARYLL
jgi:uncharacterized membrane protein